MGVSPISIMENKEIARVLWETADLMEIAGEDGFRIRSYRNGATAIEGNPERIADILRDPERKVTDIPGIGKGLAAVLAEIAATGSCDRRNTLLEKFPPGALEFLKIQGRTVGPYRILSCQSAAIPNAIAALLLYIRDRTNKIPHVYFGWTEGNPITYLLKFLAFGEGDTAPVTREVLRQTEHEPLRRPRVHV